MNSKAHLAPSVCYSAAEFLLKDTGFYSVVLFLLLQPLAAFSVRKNFKRKRPIRVVHQFRIFAASKASDNNNIHFRLKWSCALSLLTMLCRVVYLHLQDIVEV